MLLQFQDLLNAYTFDGAYYYYYFLKLSVAIPEGGKIKQGILLYR